jgi:hypothetical protein
MSYYLKLNLPANPLRYSIEVESQRAIVRGYDLIDPVEILSDEILGIFESMKLQPKFVTIFGRGDKVSSLANRLVHTDLTMNTDGTWRKMLFGVNWEIAPDCYNEFSWWDMTRIPEAWPNEELSENSKFKHLNGIHYGSTRGQMGIPDGAIKLDQTVIDGPTLVRTEIPHLTVYNSPTYRRLGLSVRFDESNFNSWDDVVKHLDSYRI